MPLEPWMIDRIRRRQEEKLREEGQRPSVRIPAPEWAQEPLPTEPQERTNEVDPHVIDFVL